MDRDLRNPRLIISTDDLSKADGMMLTPDGQVKGAIDLSAHVTRISIKGEPSYDAFRTSVPEGTEATSGGKWSATFDPNTGYWHSDTVYRAGGDGLTIEQREPWKPPYRWHQEPIKRLRVEWARRKARGWAS